MITLYTFGPRFGLTDPSPFVMKADTLLRMAKLPFKTDNKGFGKAPKGKLPYIKDGDSLVADSTFIRWYLEDTYGVDFDRGLSLEERAVGWAFEKLAEDHLYWIILDERWNRDANFEKGPATFFAAIPAPVRPFVKRMVRKQLKKQVHAQGIGRHKEDERVALGAKAIDAISDYLGAKPFFMGAEPTGVDATIFSFVAGTLCPLFESGVRTVAEKRPNLSAYVGRMTARFYPELNEMAGCRAAA